MKIKVVSEFIDKHTSELHKVGDIIECDEKRLAEINHARKGLVQVIEENEPVKEQKNASKKKKGE